MRFCQIERNQDWTPKAFACLTPEVSSDSNLLVDRYFTNNDLTDKNGLFEAFSHTNSSTVQLYYIHFVELRTLWKTVVNYFNKQLF